MIYKVSLNQFKRCLETGIVRGNKRDVLREVLYYFDNADLNMLHTTAAGHTLHAVYPAELIEQESERTGLTPDDVMMNFFTEYVVYAIEIQGHE